MICPHCQEIIPTQALAQHMGALGGSTTGPSKRRDIDYAAMGRKGAAAKKAKGARLPKLPVEGIAT